ncbi:MAG: BamA/TamA family outer membrane protein, partial [Gemmatimonadaceae bacterium]
VRDARTDRASLPRDVAREATRLYNETTALRSTARVEIAEDRTVEGDVAVINGPVLISGRVTGRVLAINGDVVLRPTARIDGDLLVVGGEVEGRHTAFIGGEIRIYRQQLQYVQEGDLIVPDRVANEEETGWWRRWERTRYRTGSKLYIATAGAYNRVEGLPINLGPQVFYNAPWGSVRLDAYAVLRTETSFSGQQDDIGYNVNSEVRLGGRGGVILGGRLYNVLEPTESWQLSQGEAALAAFLFRRDYRDYYEHHGGKASAGFFVRRGADLTLSYGEERWLTRTAENPWTLFQRSLAWRPNPTFDEGRVHLMNTTLRVDTRNNPESPWSGWYVLADLEHGFASITSYAPRSAPIQSSALPAEAKYVRGFLDFRRYNRLSPDAQLNFRIVTGGWLNGDPLPLQRRFAVDGPGSLPGYDFRTQSPENKLTCTAGAFVPGQPGQCDRMALAQVEVRGDLHFDLFTDWDDDTYSRNLSDAVWVFFADAGRGWLIGTPTAGDELAFPRGDMPPLSSFQSDIGAGLDFGGVGLYVAKSLSQPTEQANFLVRIRHRF